MRLLRQLRNAIRFKLVLLRAASTATCRHQSWTNAEREQWLHRYAPDALTALGVTVHWQGTPPSSGLVVANHLSYLDILTLSSIFPSAFVSKDDVERWPFVGWLCKVAGTIFVDRRSRGDTVRVNDLVKSRLASGSPVVVFPEGTSTGGSDVLPFKSSLLQPAVEVQATITPLHIKYEMADGDAEYEVCYWGKMVFVLHLWHMLGSKGITATVNFGSARVFPDRKTAALESREAVLALGDIGTSAANDVEARL